MNTCKLCGRDYVKLSAERYPAHSVGNDDLVKVDFQKLVAPCSFTNISEANYFFENEIIVEAYPKGRTVDALCQECNELLGRYDESYKRFFDVDGNPKTVKGFQTKTKFHIIKAIYGKFLSIPEASDQKFDFVDFVKNPDNTTYKGKWNLYFMKRNPQELKLGMASYNTYKQEFDEGVVYEMGDAKFVFNLMNFEKHSYFKMNSIFDILGRYRLVTDDGTQINYHWQNLIFGNL